MTGVCRKLLLVSAVSVACAGCSQTAALAPVGGAELGDLRYAVNDVLTDKRIEILVAPVCSGTCTGTTTGNELITATATSEDASTVKIEVGSTVLYSGSVQDVLDRNSTVGAP